LAFIIPLARTRNRAACWAIGGPATLFTTGALFARNGTALSNVALPAAGADNDSIAALQSGNSTCV
jgi:hypothetical protein